MVAEGDQAESFARFNIDQKQLEASMLVDREKRAAQYNLLLSRAIQAYDSLKSTERWNVPTPISFTVNSDNLVGDPEYVAIRKRFLEELNTQIAGAIAVSGGRHLVQVPFNPQLTTTTDGAVLLGINLAKLEFEGGKIPDGKITLLVEHPRFGVSWRGRSCFSVRDVPEGSAAAQIRLTSESWPIVIPTDVTEDWQKKIDFSNRLFRIQDVMFPLYTVYYLSVEVTEPREWKVTPRVKSIELQFVAARPN